MVLADIWADFLHPYEWEVRRGEHNSILYTPKGGGQTIAQNVFQEKGLSFYFSDIDSQSGRLVTIDFPNLPNIGDKAEVRVPLGRRWNRGDAGINFHKAAGYSHKIIQLNMGQIRDIMEKGCKDLEDRFKELGLQTDRDQIIIRAYFVDSEHRGD